MYPGPPASWLNPPPGPLTPPRVFLEKALAYLEWGGGKIIDFLRPLHKVMIKIQLWFIIVRQPEKTFLDKFPEEETGKNKPFERVLNVTVKRHRICDSLNHEIIFLMGYQGFHRSFR